jgi:hypothetical protein
MPILAATIGVLGGVLGAVTGGWIANRGQEETSKSERTAEIQDLRIAAYGNFLGTAEEVALALQERSPVAEKLAAVRRLLIAQARVVLVADKPKVLGQVAVKATRALDRWDKAQTRSDKAQTRELKQQAEELKQQATADYGRNINHFLDVARDEIEAT